MGEDVMRYVIAESDEEFDDVFRSTSNIATFGSDRDEQEYVKRDERLIEEIKRVCVEVLDPDLSAHVHHIEDWWPNHTRYVDCDLCAFKRPLVSAIHSLLSGDYEDWRVQIVVYGDMMQGPTMVGSIVLEREWALVDRALYDGSFLSDRVAGNTSP